jgi:hypothetical protein
MNTSASRSMKTTCWRISAATEQIVNVNQKVMGEKGMAPDQATQQSEQGREGNCMLLSFDTHQMLLPRNVVAEVIRHGFVNLERRPEGLQLFEWRGRHVPLLEHEELTALCAVQPGEETRIAVMHGLKDLRKLPFYGIAISRSPKLLRVSEKDIAMVECAQLGRAELMRVRLEEGEAFIPKVDYLENLILEMLDATGQ